MIDSSFCPAATRPVSQEACNTQPCVDLCAVVRCPFPKECRIDDETGQAFCADSCDILECPVGQVCELIDVPCPGPPCPPIARCVAADPCVDFEPPSCLQTGNCPEGTVCRAVPGTCVPSICFCDPATGNVICTEDCGGGTCVPADPCGTTFCQPHQECRTHEPTNEPFCADTCDNFPCPAGQVCELVDVVCVTAPCPPVAQCVPADPCVLVDCRANQVCRVHEPTGEPFCADTCDNARCREGLVCRLVDVVCVTAPCPPVAQCVPPCPLGQFLCPDGTCVDDRSLCPGFLCPPNLPFECPDGTCVTAPEECAPVCRVDADCRRFSNFCDGCNCIALGVNEPDPPCDGVIVSCFADPCIVSRTAAVCNAGTCELCPDADGDGVCDDVGCTSNDPCGDVAYCERPFGGCERVGTCVPRPDACALINDPVCGCDQVTYLNRCVAGASGVSIAHLGSCEGECRTNDDCSPLGYCQSATGACGTPGTCQPRPLQCTEEFAPVCGCDGNTYGNKCRAASAGVDVAHEGACRLRCDLPMDVGPCDAIVPRWWHNSATGQCEPFTWGGCGGNANNFETQDECKKACGGAVCGNGVIERPEQCDDGNTVDGDGCNRVCELEACQQPRKIGPCRAAIPRWWHNPDTGQCELFFWGGCQPNDNNFETEQECENACVRPFCGDRPVPVCSAEQRPVDTDNDGCPDLCVCNIAIDCAPGFIPVDTNNDGCDDTCRQFCGGIAGFICPDGFQCVDIPGDNCDPDAGGADCGGICVPTTPCGDLPVPACTDEQTPVDTDGDGCPDRCVCRVLILCAPGFVPVDTNGDGCIDACQPIGCTGDDACRPNEYCGTEDGDCGGQTSCRPRPEICPRIFAPVCGCDRRTYGNACEAAAAGVSVRHDGACRPGQCEGNQDCGFGTFCSRPTGDCDGPGTCAPRPQICIQLFDPVCGCDGRTYSNACVAASQGINVAHRGPCVPAGVCRTNEDCPPGNYCEHEDQDCDGRGECRERPVACVEIFAPVCGCDGMTYENRCKAAAAGVSVDHAGPCDPEPRCGVDADCPRGTYCAKDLGDCEGRGICEPRAQLCRHNYDPVCGCDGRTYSNACHAAVAGANIEHEGECIPECSTNADCPVDGYCAREAGDCHGPATCRRRPLACPQVIDPVCGCDGRTYINRCEAERAGVNVQADGFCDSTCTTSADCDANSYCRHRPGDCDGDSVCVPRPDTCPQQLEPVCGCDGLTYFNPCIAARNGVSVAHRGPCQRRPACSINSDCPAGAMCARPEGQCRGEGICREQPTVSDCPPVFDPVCGCDGGSYGNACRAAVAGVNVAHPGPCLPPGVCASSDDCSDRRVCVRSVGDCNGVGTCEPAPAGCPRIYDPVCGCDGQTYANQCVAQAAGVTLRHLGACPVRCGEGTPCDDGNPCTLFDTCVDGVCVGIQTHRLDVNCDGLVDHRDIPPGGGLLDRLNLMTSFGVVTVDENGNIVIDTMPTGP